uniref:Uncharacterized protein n=1 Tax=Magnetococcus massalia (strain MO-1) TaxID=451514 RepID=A0A1S7LI35_MAGMO|nr:protein of unknown function [Candidatus Magnetococcus massalia]
MIRFETPNHGTARMSSYTAPDKRRADFTMHIEVSLTDQQRQEMEEGVRSLQGVVGIRFSQKERAFAVIYYDAFLTTPVHLQEEISRLPLISDEMNTQQILQTQIVGM